MNAHKSHKSSHKKSDTVTIKVPKITKNIQKNPWILATIILAIAVIYLLYSPNTGVGTGGGVGEEKASEIVLDFAKGQGLTPELVATSVENDLYRVDIIVQGQEVPVYLTKDGKNLVPSLIPLSEIPQQGAQPTPPTTPGAEIDMDELIDDDPMKGDPNAPVTIVEFSDYECPFCKRNHEQTFKRIDEEYIQTGKVRYVFRDFTPTLVNPSYHPNAIPAAIGAECVRKQGGDDAYWEMSDALFENQGNLGEESVISLASDLGYDIRTCLESEEFLDEIQQDLTDGQAAGVSGTPGFIINGQLVSGALPFANFQQIIEAELAK